MILDLEISFYWKNNYYLKKNYKIFPVNFEKNFGGAPDPPFAWEDSIPLRPPGEPPPKLHSGSATRQSPVFQRPFAKIKSEKFVSTTAFTTFPHPQYFPPHSPNRVVLSFTLALVSS